MNRRDLMKLASLAAVGGAATTVATATSASAAPLWPGHVPGKIHLGWAPGDSLSATLSRTGPVGLRRSYFRWDEATRENKMILSDHAEGRLPWVSFKPPFTTAGGWAAVASGKYDADIRARARRYAALKAPVITTFNHEPHNDFHTGTAAEFAAAFVRIHDVMASETGLKNVAHVPIIGDWAFNKYNKNGQPGVYISPAVLNRCHFLGVDLYQNQSGNGFEVRLGYILDWLDKQGHSKKMVGIGEVGATNGFGKPGGADWWNASWKWAVANTNRIGAVAYWNSQRGTVRYNWLLWEGGSTAKLNAFKASLAHSTTAKSLNGKTWVPAGTAPLRTVGAL